MLFELRLNGLGLRPYALLFCRTIENMLKDMDFRHFEEIYLTYMENHY